MQGAQVQSLSGNINPTCCIVQPKRKKKSLTLGWEVLAYSKSLLTILVHWLRDDHYLRGKDGEEASLFKVRFGRGKNICMYNM